MKRNRVFVFAIIAVLVLTSLGLVACGGPENVVIRQITVTGATEAYIDEFDLADYTLSVDYSDGRSEKHTLTAENLSQADLAALGTLGTHTVTVSYGELTATWTIKIINHKFDGVSLPDLTVEFDGHGHSLAVEGLPDGAQVTYTNNGKTEPGTYEVTAELSRENFDPQTLSGELTITKRELAVEISGATVIKYDGEEHKDYTVTATNLVGDDEVELTLSYSGNMKDAGTYTVTANLAEHAHYTLTGNNTLAVTIARETHTVTFRQSGQPDKTVEVADLGSVADKDIPEPVQETGYNVEWEEADLSSITDDIVVEAKKTAIEYHITYEVGEGTNNPGNPETYTIEDPAFTLLAPTPKRGSFGGWYTGRNGGGERRITVGGGEIGDITLYASWLEYFITVADGFELDGTTLTATVHNSVANLDLQDKIHVSDNCTWKLYKDYEGNSELPLKAISLQTGHNTAYVIVYSNASEYFTRYTLDIYRLSMREYKFTDRGSTHKSGTIEEDSAVEKATDPARTGYEFKGWAVKGSSAIVDFPYTVKENIEFVAQWTANKYTAHLDAANGEGLDSADKTMTYDSAYNFPTLTRTGYTFLGWYAGNDKLTGADGRSLAPWKYASDKDITAKWQANKYSLKVESNDDARGTVTGEGSFDYDSQVTIKATTKPGYTFIGWYDSEDKKVESELEYTFTKGLEETYTAKWIKVTLEATTGGKVTTVFNGTYTAGEQITYNAATDSGYTFIGWYNEDSKLSLDLAYETTMTDKDTTYTAKWIKVTLKASTGGSVTELTGTYIAGEQITYNAATDPGYTFIGWYNEESGKLSPDLAYDTTMTDKDTTYTAKWIKVTLKATTGGEVITVLDGTYTAGEQVALAAEAHLGYHFVGWHSGDEKVNDDIDYTITMPEVDTTYTATWEVNAEMNNFEFDSTTDACQITGVKDKSVQSITIPEYVTEIAAGIFAKCTELKSIEVAPDNNAYSSLGGVLYNSDRSAIIYVPLGIKVVTAISDKITFIGSDVFSNRTKLTNIVIPNNVTSINSSAFSGCTALESIEVAPDNSEYSSLDGILYNSDKTTIEYVPLGIKVVTAISDKITSIGSGAFSNHTQLTSIVIPKTVTYIGKSTFSGCNKLTCITLPFVGDGNSNTCFGYIFGANSYSYNSSSIPASLKTVTITGGDKIAANAFYNCKNITNIIIQESITSITSGAFSGCSGLVSMTLPFVGDKRHVSADINRYPFGYIFGTKSYTGGTKTAQKYYGSSTSSAITSYYYIPSSLRSVTIAGCDYIPYGAFYGCDNLTEVIISDSVTLIGNYVLYGCNKLERVSIPFTGDGDGNITYFGYLFGAQSASDNSRFVPGSLKAVEVTGVISGYAFSDCGDLTEITIGEDVTSIGGWAFYNCTTLQTVNWNATNCAEAYKIFSGCTSLSTVNIGENVQNIPEYMFYGCSGLTEITIPASVTAIGGDAFDGCTNLQTVNWNATNCTKAGESGGVLSYDAIFFGCTSLTTVNIGENVETIPAYAFYNCSKLTEITIPASVTSIGAYAFYNCSKLTEITIPASVTSIGAYAFCNCRNLTSITILASVTSIGGEAFYNCSGLTKVNITDLAAWCNIDFSNSSANPLYYAHNLYINDELKAGIIIPEEVTEIKKYTFYGCTSITEVTIHDDVTSIGDEAFYNCTTLQTVNWNATNCTTGRFSGCTSLTTVNIGANVETIPAYAFSGCSGLTEITIPASVTSIGDGAFYGCSNLTSITIPSSVTSIGDSAFSGCSGLTEITIPANVTSIGDNAFYNCTKLQTVNWNATNCTKAGSYDRYSYIFNNCTSLTTLNIGANIETIPEYAFSDCTTLQTVNWNATNCTTGRFSGCTSLTTVNIGENVETMPGGAFSGCTKLQTVNWNATNCTYREFSGRTSLTTVNIGANVETIPDYAFSGCTGLLTVTFAPDSRLKSIGKCAFENCSGLAEITIPSSVTSIGNSAFYNCTNLQMVTFDGDSRLKSIGEDAFRGCSNLTSITIPASVTSICEWAFNNCTNLQTVNWNATNCTTAESSYAIFSGCTSLSAVNIGANVETIPAYAFHDCSKLKEITIPASVTSIGNRAFSGCRGLTEITIPASVTSIGESAFEYCTNLQTVNWNATNCTKAGGWKSYYNAYNAIFSGCTSLTTVNIGANVETIPDYAFYDCANLQTINWNATNCTYAGSYSTSNSYIYNCTIFQGCTSLTTVNIGENVQTIPAYTFYNCSKITKITIPSSVTSIGDMAFRNCTNLQTVTFAPDSRLESICDYAFSSCTNLQTVTFAPDSRLKSIGDYAFRDCSKLTSITIPASVTSICEYAFCYCTNLQTVTFEEPNGWKVSENSDMSSPIALSSSSLQNSSTAAKYLKSTYYNYYWKRTEA